MTQMSKRSTGRMRLWAGQGAALLRRFAAPAALGMLMSLSTVGHAGLPAKRVTPVAAASTSVAALQPSAAAQMALLQQIKAAKTPAQNKIDARLFLGMMKLRGDARMSGLPDFRFVKNEADGRVAVDLIVASHGGVKAVIEKLRDMDSVMVTPKSVAFATRTLRVRLPMSDLEALSAMREVKRIRQAAPAHTSAARGLGPITAPPARSRASTPVANALTVSEGVQAHGVAAARATYGTTGAGQMICAISDGIDSLAASQASNDLPAGIFVLPGQAGEGDEGTAMLEIIHDVAPGATLGFATAFNGEGSFAQNIIDLAAAGCTIIVDDIIYLDESPWQDGPVAQAVNTVTAAGVLYFSSAGNEGNLTDGTSGVWEGSFLATAMATPTALNGAGQLHNFGDGGLSMLVTAGGATTPVVLIWAEHFTLDEGFASTDYDVYVTNGALTTVFDASVDAQDGVGGDDFPVEFVAGGAFTGERVVVARFAPGTTSTTPAFQVQVFRGEVNPALATGGSTRGHSAAANAFSLAATPAADSFDGITADGPFPGLFTSVNVSESFTADGPRRIILSPTGQELTPGNRTFSGGVVRQKPDLTAADGVSTSAPGFDPFYGTSASAPHAAAIAALVKSAVPSLTMAEMRNVLTSTAIDIEAPGVDRNTGFGIVMPGPALASLGATGQPSLTAGTAAYAQVVGDGDAFIEPNETWSINLPVTNNGAATAVGINGTLSSSTANVTIVNATSAYADLGVGASGTNSAPYLFRVDTALLCGTPLVFSVNVSYNGPSSPLVAALTAPTGAPGAQQSFSYTGPVVPIPDSPGAAVRALLPVSGVGTVSDVNLRIDGDVCNANIGATTVGIDHTFVSDLEVRVVAPNGQVIRVIDNADGGGNNFCQTLLDDESAGPNIQTIITAQAPFVGSFRPSTALSGFDGVSADGNWALEVQDFAGADVGSIRRFSLQLTGGAVCDAPVGVAPAVVSVLRANASPTNAASVGYTVTFSTPVSGVDAADFALTTTGALSGAAVSSVSGSGDTYTVTVGTGSGDGTLRLDVVDDDSIVGTLGGQPLGGVGAGNGSFIAGEVYAIDRTGPTAAVAVGGGQPNPVLTPPVVFTVQFDEVTGQFDAADVVLGGTAGATSANVSGSGSSYSVAVSGMTANGTVTLAVRAGAIVDAAGNNSLLSNTATANFNGIFVPDTSPDPFSFAPVTGVLRNAVVTSAPVVITGINTATPISISSGSYSVNGSSFKSVPGIVLSGDRVVVRQTASNRFNTTTTVVLTVGDVSAPFAVTTRRLLEPLFGN